MVIVVFGRTYTTLQIFNDFRIFVKSFVSFYLKDSALEYLL